MREMGWEADEEVNQDKNGEADGMNLEVDPSIRLILKCRYHLEAKDYRITWFLL